jgi:probable LLM family oxidoreductase
MAVQEFEFGLDTPAYVSVDESGQPIDGDVVIRNTVEEAVLADSVGIDSFNISEHYRTDFMDSAGHVMLAAIAGRTNRIRLGTAVTVLSTQDPVRVYTEFATLDAVSNGRAQLIVGRGSLPDSFPLFGFDLADYETLFEEKLDLLTRLLRDQPVTWSGTVRSPLTDQYVMPPLPEGHLPTWVGVGGSPQSVIRAARYGLPLIFAGIGGHPSRFVPFVELYKRALAEYGHPLLPIGMHSHGYVAKTDEEAVDIQWPYWADMYAASPERGNLRPAKSGFLSEITDGSMYVGSPETVATKLARSIRLLGLNRFDLAYALGRVPHEQRMATIELYGREVIPRVREILAAGTQ